MGIYWSNEAQGYLNTEDTDLYPGLKTRNFPTTVYGMLHFLCRYDPYHYVSMWGTR